MAVSASKRTLVETVAQVRARELAPLVDELGALEKEYAPLKLKFDRIDGLRKQIRGAFDSAPSGDSARVDGELFFISLGPRADKQSVNVRALFKSLGARVFLDLCSVTLTALKEAKIGYPSSCITSFPSGPRPLQVFEKVIT